jgi:hypothetical protein
MEKDRCAAAGLPLRVVAWSTTCVHMNGKSTDLKPWAALTADEQLAFQTAYQSDLDRQPKTCSLDEKVNRFAAWLADRGVSFSADDLSRKPRQTPPEPSA